MKGLNAGSAPKGDAKGAVEGEGAPNESSGSASFKSSTLEDVFVLDPDNAAEE